jgi:capsular polysaccharide export protein
MKRHYSHLEFVPVRRIRSLIGLKNFDSYDQLPGSDICDFFDNEGWALAKSAQRVILVTDTLGDLLKGYDSFTGMPYLKADPDKVAEWRARLARWTDKPLVGLSWRSSLATSGRNEHYLSVEQLAPLFELDHVRFVNLQYDDCTDELAWLEQRFPGRILNFPDLDQFNDLDGVAALMNCVDLIVAPATTVVELAGALGCPTLLLSNSPELHWRKLPGTMTDVWHRTVTHVEGETLGDKASLIRSLAAILQKVPRPQPGLPDGEISPTRSVGSSSTASISARR